MSASNTPLKVVLEVVDRVTKQEKLKNSMQIVKE